MAALAFTLAITPLTGALYSEYAYSLAPREESFIILLLYPAPCTEFENNSLQLASPGEVPREFDAAVRLALEAQARAGGAAYAAGVQKNSFLFGPAYHAVKAYFSRECHLEAFRALEASKKSAAVALETTNAKANALLDACGKDGVESRAVRELLQESANGSQLAKAVAETAAMASYAYENAFSGETRALPAAQALVGEGGILQETIRLGALADRALHSVEAKAGEANAGASHEVAIAESRLEFADREQLALADGKAFSLATANGTVKRLSGAANVAEAVAQARMAIIQAKELLNLGDAAEKAKKNGYLDDATQLYRLALANASKAGSALAQIEERTAQLEEQLSVRAAETAGKAVVQSSGAPSPQMALALQAQAHAAGNAPTRGQRIRGYAQAIGEAEDALQAASNSSTAGLAQRLQDALEFARNAEKDGVDMREEKRVLQQLLEATSFQQPGETAATAMQGALQAEASARYKLLTRFASLAEEVEEALETVRFMPQEQRDRVISASSVVAAGAVDANAAGRLLKAEGAVKEALAWTVANLPQLAEKQLEENLEFEIAVENLAAGKETAVMASAKTRSDVAVEGARVKLPLPQGFVLESSACRNARVEGEWLIAEGEGEYECIVNGKAILATLENVKLKYTQADAATAMFEASFEVQSQINAMTTVAISAPTTAYAAWPIAGVAYATAEGSTVTAAVTARKGRNAATVLAEGASPVEVSRQVLYADGQQAAFKITFKNNANAPVESFAHSLQEDASCAGSSLTTRSPNLKATTRKTGDVHFITIEGSLAPLQTAYAEYFVSCSSIAEYVQRGLASLQAQDAQAAVAIDALGNNDYYKALTAIEKTREEREKQETLKTQAAAAGAYSTTRMGELERQAQDILKTAAGANFSPQLTVAAQTLYAAAKAGEKDENSAKQAVLQAQTLATIIKAEADGLETGCESTACVKAKSAKTSAKALIEAGALHEAAAAVATAQAELAAEKAASDAGNKRKQGALELYSSSREEGLRQAAEFDAAFAGNKEFKPLPPYYATGDAAVKKLRKAAATLDALDSQRKVDAASIELVERTAKDFLAASAQTTAANDAMRKDAQDALSQAANAQGQRLQDARENFGKGSFLTAMMLARQASLEAGAPRQDPTVLVAGGVLAIAILSGLAFLFLRKPQEPLKELA